jgi:hypothetical protein
MSFGKNTEKRSPHGNGYVGKNLERKKNKISGGNQNKSTKRRSWKRTSLEKN